MDFGYAIKQLKLGKKLSRKEWIIGDYIFLDVDKKRILLHCEDGSINGWFANSKNILAEDWYVVMEER